MTSPQHVARRWACRHCEEKWTGLGVFCPGCGPSTRIEPAPGIGIDDAPGGDNAPCEACGSMSFLLLGRRVRRALLDVAQERKKQDEKWGAQSHNGVVWMAILGEEVGEANKAVLRDVFDKAGPANVRVELVQVAAVAIAIIEQIDTERLKGLSHDYMRRTQ